MYVYISSALESTIHDISYAQCHQKGSLETKTALISQEKKKENCLDFLTQSQHRQ